jgi:hypothetical protein
VKGDFSLVRFAPRKHFSSVQAQQVRVALDSDQNEASAIFNHALRLLARTVIGRYGGTRTRLRSQRRARGPARAADDRSRRLLGGRHSV